MTEDDYTKQEKTIYLNPTAALAAAVIRQWRLDGCPDSSKKEIEMWQAIYNEAVDYYRQRPDEYCEDIIGIKLNVYQKIMLRCIFKYDYIMFIMCRPWAW